VSAPEEQSTEGPLLDPLIGATIAGKFRIEEFLGAGAMGRVFRARQIALDKPVAIKVLNASLAADPTFVARFAREAKAAARLDHPNSIRVFDFGREPSGVFYIAMELVSGNDLATEIEALGPMPSDRIAGVLGQVLAALSVAHEMGVLHRDLKPANVLIVRRKDDDGRAIDLAKVCDFGIAKIVDSAAEPPSGRAGTHPLTAGLVVGTPEYMAPEQARGAPVDARADLYAVGVILYQMLTARLPFVSDTPLGMVIKHVTEQPPRPSAVRPDVDPALEAICLKALEKNPADRFQTAAEMRVALLAAVRQAPSGTSQAVDPAFGPSWSPTVANLVLGPPTRDESKQATLGGVTPGKQAKGAPSAGRWSRRVAMVASGALLVGGALVAASMRHAAKDQRAPSAGELTATVAPLAPALPTALATIATVESSSPVPVEPTPNKTVAPPVSPAKPTRTRNPTAVEPSAKAPATAELAAASAPPEPLAAPAPVAPAPPPASSEPPPPIVQVPVATATPAPPRFDASSARVLVGSAVRVSGATTSSVNRALAAVAPQLTACYRAVLPQLSGPVDGEGTLHIESDGAGTITDARFAGPLGQSIQGCAASAVVGRRIANVDTGSASADVPLVYRPR
jgi:serine/threonine-protein kinase